MIVSGSSFGGAVEISSTLMATLLISLFVLQVATAGEGPRFPVLSNEETWKVLPTAETGGGQPLPVWARMLAAELPRTTAACLQLDFAHRESSPIPGKLRAAMRYVAATANRCEYSKAQSLNDAKNVGVTEEHRAGLAKGDWSPWTASEQAALQFAHDMTVDSDSVTDRQFAELVSAFGEKQTACMVLLMAYSNFQDRLLLSLGVSEEPGGPHPALDVRFPSASFVGKTIPPARPASSSNLPEKIPDRIIRQEQEGSVWKRQNYDFLQQRMKTQKARTTRLPIPPWEQISRQLPDGLMTKPTDIVWYQIVFGYAPELAVPFELVMRTAGAESSERWDRVFASGLFWVTTKAVECPYCMGHCEMNWEVAGLSAKEIERRSRLLSDTDWSDFPAAEQHAYAYARKLARSPWDVTDEDMDLLKQFFRPDMALLVIFHASRHHYMTRISNGFQLQLESTNVFYDYYNVTPPPAVADAESGAVSEPAISLLTDAACWERLPKAISGQGSPLPTWARAVAVHLPRTAAAMLLLDHEHRTNNPIGPVLRAKMRWVIADANRCDYSRQYALADLKRAGASETDLRNLTTGPGSWPEADKKPLEFAFLLTTAAPKISDELFENLRQEFGNEKVASMVLLGAYGNFQDRIVLGLNLPLEESGPLPPVKVQFVEGALQMNPLLPKPAKAPEILTNGKDIITDDGDWGEISFEELQSRLERQRDRKPRLPIPTWDEVKVNLPDNMKSRPTRIVWNLVNYRYAPELAVRWSATTRTMWAEAPGDRVFEESLFWIQTRAIECNYCMGHCEMLLEVAGLNKTAVADRTRKLACNDWSAFSPTEQRAYAYARKLTKTPWKLSVADYRNLENDLGSPAAMSTFFWLCRGLYMTRISDGFQLPLERENVFDSIPVVK